MAYQTGTATDYHDLLRKLITFVTGASLGSQAWTLLRDIDDFRLTRSASSDQNSSGFTASAAFDGVIADQGWRTTPSGTTTGWLRCDFVRAVEILEFAISARTTNLTESPKDFQLQYSDDGSGWTNAGAAVTGATGWTAGETRTYAVSPAPGAHTYWRLNVTANNGETLLALSELQLRKTAAGTNIARYTKTEHILRGPGLAGADQIFVGIRQYESQASDYYNFELTGFTGYGAGLDFTAQPGYLTTPVYVHLWNSSIPYWLIANGRRIVLVAKVSTVYQALHLGFINPYASPGQYPYPLAIGGCSDVQTQRWSATDESHRHFTDPGAYTLYLRDPGGLWQGFANFWQSNGEAGLYTNNVWPYQARSTEVQNLFRTLRDQPDATYALFPLILTRSSPTVAGLGEIDGCFALSGHNNAAENICQVSSQDHLVVQNVFRTARYYYWALKLV